MAVISCFPVFKGHVFNLDQVFKGEAKQKSSLAWAWLSTLFTPTQQTLLVKDLDHSKSLSAGSMAPWMYVIWTRWLRVRRSKSFGECFVASLLSLPRQLSNEAMHAADTTPFCCSCAFSRRSLHEALSCVYCTGRQNVMIPLNMYMHNKLPAFYMTACNSPHCAIKPWPCRWHIQHMRESNYI